MIQQALDHAEWVPPSGLGHDDAWRRCPDARWLIGEAVRRRASHRALLAAVRECIRRAEEDESIGALLPEELSRAVASYLDGGSAEILAPWVVLADDLDAALPTGWTEELASRQRRWLGEPGPGQGMFWAVVVPSFARMLRDRRTSDRLCASPILAALASERADMATRRARATCLREVAALVEAGTRTGTQIYGPEAFAEVSEAVFLTALREMADTIRARIALESLARE